MQLIALVRVSCMSEINPIDIQRQTFDIRICDAINAPVCEGCTVTQSRAVHPLLSARTINSYCVVL